MKVHITTNFAFSANAGILAEYAQLQVFAAVGMAASLIIAISAWILSIEWLRLGRNVSLTAFCVQRIVLHGEARDAGY
ncbi:hypothetical protein BOTBODRAFT_272974 [Botryobasidium botryosum FD-172 SS1]|uniref:Uncharacterized protein n=1 Tax=Botryobasidium botryosum (strain FD-172 SS1) TaxID=930990 RepID=A0A067MW79_BOTB1|nr:hypothetical protein BOTBODRAFT_272974 [Botryobasidium botryosum FD-172 SS1]